MGENTRADLLRRTIGITLISVHYYQSLTLRPTPYSVVAGRPLTEVRYAFLGLSAHTLYVDLLETLNPKPKPQKPLNPKLLDRPEESNEAPEQHSMEQGSVEAGQVHFNTPLNPKPYTLNPKP